MVQVGVHEAKTHLSRLLQRVAAGDEVIITRAGVPIAKLMPVEGGGRRVLGQDAGRLVVPNDFDAPLPDSVVSSFES